jgi:hypothetical protein
MRKLEYVDLLKLEFHDSGLACIEFNFIENEIKVVFEPNVDDLKSLIFREVSALQVDGLYELENFEDLEINSFDFKSTGNYFQASLILLTGFGKPSATISFKFQKVHSAIQIAP